MYISTRAGDISFAAAGTFLFGVFAANTGWNLWLLGFTGALFAIAAISLSHFREAWKSIAIIFLAAVIGVLYYYAYIHWQTAYTKMPTGKQAAFFGIVTEEPKTAGSFILLNVSLLRPYAGTVDIFTSTGSIQFHYGDEIWIRGTVNVSKNMGESPVLFLPRLRVVAQHGGFWPKEQSINFKEWIVQKIAQALPADQAALLAGIMIGTTDTLNASLKAQMETSGTSYIVGMYGYKIIIIAFMLAAALKDRLSRRMLLWITLVTILFFVTASGGAISAIRAAIMGSFAIVARGTGKLFNARNALTFAATGMVIANATLLTNAAFQLSFMSFLGIYYLGPPIDNYFHWTNGGALRWKEHAMLSLSTNLAILPIVMNTFGRFSLTSFVSNILIMIPWLAVILFGALVVLFGLISPYLAFCAVQIVSVLLRYELFIIRIFTEFTIPIPAAFDSAFVIALYYGILILFAYYYASPSQKNN